MNNRRNIFIIIIVAVVLIAIAAVVAVIAINDSNNKKAVGIEITQPAIKLEYYKYDKLDLTGLELRLRKNSAQYDEIIDLSKVTVTGFDSSKVEDRQTVTLTYEGFSTTFVVKIVELPEPQPAVVGLKLEMDEGYELKTEYKVGEALDLSHMYLVVTYSDGTTARISVTLEHVSGFDSRRPATEQRIKVAYGGLFTKYYVNIVE